MVDLKFIGTEENILGWDLYVTGETNNDALKAFDGLYMGVNVTLFDLKAVAFSSVETHKKFYPEDKDIADSGVMLKHNKIVRAVLSVLVNGTKELMEEYPEDIKVRFI